MDAEKYLAWLLESTPGVVRRWIGQQRLGNSVERELAQTIEARGGVDHGQEFMQQCPVPGASPADYCLGEIALSSQTTVLAGIHFYGGDVSLPFVGVYAQSRWLSHSEMLEASRRLCDAFAVFKPAWTWWWLTTDGNGSYPPEAVADQRLLVGDLRAIRRRPIPHSPLSIRLCPDSDGSSYAEYVAIFERFVELNPFLGGCLERTEHDEYVECARAGGLCTVEAGGRCAGVIAARPGCIRGVPGWEVVEEILDEDYRGRGIAPVMQRMFLDRLEPGIQPLVIGTIDGMNEPSRRTALRVGRQDEGGWVFMPGRAGDPVAPISLA